MTDRLLTADEVAELLSVAAGASRQRSLVGRQARPT
jgi:hypothetical protein